MSGITSFLATPSDGALNFTWGVSADVIYPSNIKSISIHLTDRAMSGTAASAITNTKLVPHVSNGAIVLQSTITGLTNNTEYLALLEINTTTDTYTRACSPAFGSSIRPGTPPQKPVFSVISTDSKLTLKFPNYLSGTAAEGYYPINAFKVYYNTGSELKLKTFSRPTDFTSYTADFEIGSLANNVVHELSVIAENAIGASVMSDTVLATPGNGVAGLQAGKQAAISTLEYNRANGVSPMDAVTATVLFGNATNQAILFAGGYPIQKYNIYRQDVSSNGSALIPGTKVLAGSILVDVSGVSLTPDVSYNYSPTGVSQTPFRFIDSDVTLGRFYQYSVAGVNSYGEGQSTVVGTAKIGAMASAPTIMAVPSNGSIKVFVTNGSLNGYDLLASGYDFDVCGNVTSNVSLDASGAYTFTGLSNGTSYVIKARTATTNGGSPYTYDGYWSSAVTSMPYTLPGQPVLVASPIDDSGIPLNGAVDLSWNVPARNGNTGAISYNIYLGGALLVYGVTATTYRVSSLVNGTSYSFEVEAVIQNTEINAPQTGPKSSPAQNVTPFTMPTAATNVSLTVGSSSQLNASWAAPANASTYGLTSSNIRYKYELRVASNDSLVGSATLNSSATSANYTSLTAGTLYKFIITPGWIYNSSPYYNDSAATFVFRAPYAAPSAPQNLVAQPMDGKIRLTWDAPSSLNGVTATLYRVFVANTSSANFGSSVATVGYGTSEGSEYVIVDTFRNGDSTTGPLVNGSSYKVAVDVFGTVPSTLTTTLNVDGVDATPVTAIPDAAPAAPTIAPTGGIVGGNRVVDVKWIRDPTVTGYIVYIGDNPIRKQALSSSTTGTDFTFDSQFVTFRFGGNGNAASNIIGSVANSQLTNGESYNIKIVAYRTNSSASDITSLSTDRTIYPIASPSTPTGFKVTVDANGTAVFTWNTATGADTGGAGVGTNGPLLYKILIDASNSDSSLNVITQDGITGTTYTTTGTLIDNKQYKAELYAYFMAGGQPYQSTVPAFISNVTTNPAPQDVSGLTAVASDHKVTLSWVNPTGIDNVLYPKVRTVILKSTDGGDYSVYKVDASNATSFVDMAGASVASGVTINSDGTISGSGTRVATTADVYNGKTYSYKVICMHGGSAVEGAQQPSGAVVSAVPFGKPIIGLASYDGFGNQIVNINKNGSNLQEYLLVGVDPSGLDIPVYNGVIPANAVYTGNNDMGAPYYTAAYSSYALTIQTPIDYTAPGSGAALLATVQNAAGISTRVYPSGSSLFTSNP